MAEVVLQKIQRFEGTCGDYQEAILNQNYHTPECAMILRSIEQTKGRGRYYGTYTIDKRDDKYTVTYQPRQGLPRSSYDYLPTLTFESIEKAEALRLSRTALLKSSAKKAFVASQAVALTFLVLLLALIFFKIGRFTTVRVKLISTALLIYSAVAFMIYRSPGELRTIHTISLVLSAGFLMILTILTFEYGIKGAMLKRALRASSCVTVYALGSLLISAFLFDLLVYRCF